jgi:general stress protein 26
MKKLREDIVKFFREQSFVIVSTFDRRGGIHNSCKGIVKINSQGRLYLFDLYKGRTFENLRQNSNISITAIEEHKFKGFCLKGKAKIIRKEEFELQAIKAWDDNIINRISKRILRNIQDEKSQLKHLEARLPKPEYMIVTEVKEIVDLTPDHLR